MSKSLFIGSDDRGPQAARRLSRGRGRLDELHEDSVRIDREHEPSKRTLNGLRADAEEPVARVLGVQSISASRPLTSSWNCGEPTS